MQFLFERKRHCNYIPIFEITRTIYSNSESSVQFLKQNAFLTCSWRFLRDNTLEQFGLKLEKNNWDLETNSKSLKNNYLIKKKFSDSYLAVLNEDGAIVFGDIRPDRGSSDNWILQGRTSTILPLVRILFILYDQV